MLDQFIDREEELEFLESKYSSNDPEFVILYGRRRVGKTELIKQFIDDKTSVYHLVSRETEKDQLSEFQDSLARTFPEISDLKQDWGVLLKNLKNKKKTILVIDEFQYLIETDSEVLKIFQKIWDEHLKESKVTLILTGSSVGMMESEVLGYKSPLYGRRTGQLKLKPFTLKQVRSFFPKTELKEQIKIYSILGGIPYYLEQFDRDKSLKENVLDNIIKTGSVLREEAITLLREELREPKSYFSILKAISSGTTIFNRISNKTGIKGRSLSKYLIRLQDLHLIEKRLPVTASKKSKRGRYYIEDNYLDFWFKFIFPNQSYLEQNPQLFYDDIIEPELDFYTSKKFEDVCKEFIISNKNTYSKVGNWWYKEDEIDIVALNERDNKILFGECKWSNREVDHRLLDDLKSKSKKVRWNKDRKEEYVLFSKSGFAEDLVKKASGSKDLSLYSPKDMFQDL